MTFWFFQRSQPVPKPPQPRPCRRRLPEAPSVVCGLPRGHTQAHSDERDPSFGFKWVSK